MKCPHCSVGIGFTPTGESGQFEDSDRFVFSISWGECSECDGFIVARRYWGFDNSRGFTGDLVPMKWEPIFPPPSEVSIQVPEDIPEPYSLDFIEVKKLLSVSPRACALMGRRLLQRILRQHYEINKKDLFEEIKAFKELDSVPSDLVDSLNAIRDAGNLTAHVNPDPNTSEILDVEPSEAEVLIEFLDELMDHTFVRPVKHQRVKDSLARKQAASRTNGKNLSS